MAANGNGTMQYTIRELLELYRLTERAVAESIFGAGWTPSHTAAVSADRLRALRRGVASGAGRRPFDEAIALTDRLGRQIRCLANGIRGEDELEAMVDLVHVPHVSLGPLGIALDGYREEIDRLVVTRHCLFLLEAKYQTTSYDIDAHGFLYGGASERPYDITYRLARKRAAIRALLETVPDGRPDLSIRCCLVLMNHRVKVHNGCPGIRWFFAGDLLRYIEHVDDDLFDERPIAMETLATELDGRSVPYRAEPDIDIVALYRDLAELFPEAAPEGWRTVFTYAPGADGVE